MFPNRRECCIYDLVTFNAIHLFFKPGHSVTTSLSTLHKMDMRFSLITLVLLNLSIYFENNILDLNLNILVMFSTKNIQSFSTGVWKISQTDGQVALSTLRYPRYSIFHANELSKISSQTGSFVVKRYQPISGDVNKHIKNRYYINLLNFDKVRVILWSKKQNRKLLAISLLWVPIYSCYEVMYDMQWLTYKKPINFNLKIGKTMRKTISAFGQNQNGYL